ncbi:MAG TPA: inositol monophosphatase family protein, partial [Thermodesulfobacteriota bacterium]|nr:inositol monophosphatase family protein [Thermodesulfobacteriota bacterium]
LAENDPEATVVSEEGRLVGRPGAGWCWFVDPIDGTADFVAGTGEWTVLLGATYAGRPVLGVAAQPLPAAVGWGPRLFWAAAGLGAWDERLPAAPEGAGREGEAGPPPRRLAVTDTAALEAARILVGKSRHRPGFVAHLEALPHAALLRVGSLSLKAALVAGGAADAYASASLQTSVWDLVAPTVIVEEAGGRVTDLAGRPLTFAADEPTWRRGILISNGRLHAALVAALARHAETR